MKNKETFGLLTKSLIIMSLIQAVPSMAFNTESAMLYNFSHKIAKKTSPRKFAKPLAYKKPRTTNSTINTEAKPDIPKSKTSTLLKCPLKLVPKKRQSIPVKVVPKFGSVPVQSTVNADYLYNSVLNSNLYLDYNSTIFIFSGNSINVKTPIAAPHNKN